MKTIDKAKSPARTRIEDLLAQIESDERLKYPPANVAINAPLALIQVALENQRTALMRVLKILDEEGVK